MCGSSVLLRLKNRNKEFNIKTSITLLLLCIFSVKAIAQIADATRAFAHDKGLVNASEPFAPVGNPALLTLKDSFRFKFELYRAVSDDYNISLAYPLSPLAGLGISYSSIYKDEIQTIPSGIFQVINKKQTFMFSIGQDFIMQWGQQLEIDFELNRFSTINVINRENIPFLNDQRIKCFYRIGIYKQLFKQL